jgi:hypothetical protein
MNRFCKRIGLLLFVVGVALLLFSLLPLLRVFEIIFIALGILCILWGIIWVDDQIHLYRMRQQWREIHLSRHKQQLPHQRIRRYY